MRKRILNYMRLAVFISAFASAGVTLGQDVVDPQIAAIQVAPNAIPVGTTATASVNFSVGGQGATTAPVGSVTIQVSFPNSYRPVPEGTPTITQTVPLFTFTYDALNRTFNGTNSVALAPGDGTQIDITVGGYTATASATTVANLSYAPQPPGNITENDNRSTTASVTGAPNPVSLISFTAQKEAQTAVLSWSTAEEINSDRFEVEHSLNGKNWRMIGSVAARGNSSSTQWYTFTDADPADGSNLYRLRMVDRDGTFDYTRARSLEFDIRLETALYPNPVSERLLLKAGDLSQIRRVELYNASGKSVLESEAITASGIDVKGLPTGFYVVRVTRTNGSTDTFKVLKQ
ncbi:T9SS type A sorting domain-containing protein [Salmonirosea aquatica]|uniref:T9SS type A sorting domain-containing protein n=1 Tax=Salmonirosea aquatica TaxID=2654236 RepID=A0A7C9FXL8_9BACT|nr:T9SS type A sorting domain-containing protein [Cytophagaceae bacterium SJW1-29]